MDCRLFHLDTFHQSPSSGAYEVYFTFAVYFSQAADPIVHLEFTFLQAADPIVHLEFTFLQVADPIVHLAFTFYKRPTPFNAHWEIAMEVWNEIKIGTKEKPNFKTHELSILIFISVTFDVIYS